jgi:hypothetical protein
MTTAGYSGTPLPKKLGIKAGAVVAFPGAPEDFKQTLGRLPEGVTVRNRTQGKLDVVVLFVTKRSELERRFTKVAAALEPNGGLWVGWPKKSSGVETDLTFTDVQEIGLAAGLVDNKVCAIDGTWSGLRFVYRVSDRPKRMKTLWRPRDDD